VVSSIHVGVIWISKAAPVALWNTEQALYNLRRHEFFINLKLNKNIVPHYSDYNIYVMLKMTAEILPLIIDYIDNLLTLLIQPLVSSLIFLS